MMSLLQQCNPTDLFTQFQQCDNVTRQTDVDGSIRCSSPTPKRKERPKKEVMETGLEGVAGTCQTEDMNP
jgi:hypothetical protein